MLTVFWPIRWDNTSISERYSGQVGEEWKERLSAKIEGKDYIPNSKSPTEIPVSLSISSNTRFQPHNSSRSNQSPVSAHGCRAKVNNKYFASLGALNASRPSHIPPSQGGKYCGFGSQPLESPIHETALPNFQDLQKDPVAALTRSFGWLTTTVGKTAKAVNEDFIQPTAKSVYKLSNIDSLL